MTRQARENCGVVGLHSLSGSNVVPLAIEALRALQHRGQEAWGIAVPGRDPLRRTGLVSASHPDLEAIARDYSSPCAIGHVRYSTVGASSIGNAQPLRVGDLCVAHNGTIANAGELSQMAGGCTFTPQSASDTMVAARRLVSLISERGGMGRALSVLKDEMVGSYCFAFISDGGSVYAARDPKGFRPMVLGHRAEGGVRMVASESAALAAAGASLQRDVRPGELLRLSASGEDSEAFSESAARAHCSFEFTYFAHPSSRMEGRGIYAARKRIGELMAARFRFEDADVVVPVPDSARPAALGYSQASGVPLDEGLLKDRYSRKGPLRSFIEPHQSDRAEINRAIIPIPDVVRGRHVVVVDDSLVRGTSSRAIVAALRGAGARRISMLVTYPPIRHPCYAGIDFPSAGELAAHGGGGSEEDAVERVRADIGADFLGYNDAATLAEAVGIPESSMCFSCHTGDYSPLGGAPEERSRADVKGERPGAPAPRKQFNPPPRPARVAGPGLGGYMGELRRAIRRLQAELDGAGPAPEPIEGMIDSANLVRANEHLARTGRIKSEMIGAYSEYAGRLEALLAALLDAQDELKGLLRAASAGAGRAPARRAARPRRRGAR